jgi:2-amino-4-hydroxy-6-hydroxymethyldihydropteridine diphosphokinase
MARTGIALGSNIGNRLANLEAAAGALAALSSPGAHVLRAPVYQTEPMFCPEGSPVFFNTVIEIEWNADPFELLEKTQALETFLGRTAAAVRNAPRVIDIDLLYCGDAIIDSEALVLPHPGIGVRSFVLEPLAQIRAELILPGHRITIREMLDGLIGPGPSLVIPRQNFC